MTTKTIAKQIRERAKFESKNPCIHEIQEHVATVDRLLLQAKLSANDLDQTWGLMQRTDDAYDTLVKLYTFPERQVSALKCHLFYFTFYSRINPESI